MTDDNVVWEDGRKQAKGCETPGLYYIEDGSTVQGVPVQIKLTKDQILGLAEQVKEGDA